MNAQEKFKKYVELRIAIEKEMEPYDKLLGSEWGDNGLFDAIWNMYDYIETLCEIPDVTDWQRDMIHSFVFDEASGKNNMTLDELAETVYMTIEEFNAWYKEHYPLEYAVGQALELEK